MLMKERQSHSIWKPQPLRQSRPAAAARDSGANASQKRPHACYQPPTSFPYKQKQKFFRMINSVAIYNTREGVFAKH